jgi:hypothetical protein
VQSDLEQLRGIITVTEAETREIINLCIKGVEACKTHTPELGTGPTPERIAEIRLEIIGPRAEIQTKHNDTFQRFLMHVCQSAHLKFEMETVMQCTRQEDMLPRFVGWYAFVGDISEICLQSLEKARDKLYAAGV